MSKQQPPISTRQSRQKLKSLFQRAVQARCMLAPAWSAMASALLVCVVPGIAACGRTSSGYERYVPAASLAEEALDQVLAAWKAGAAAGPLRSKSSQVTIEVADATRRAGQRLVDYQLLGEVSGEGPRTFVVRLRLENPTAEEQVRYYLVGIDPLWVFRQEDYDAVAHWDVCNREDVNDKP